MPPIAEKAKQMRFDWTVNLGHVLTFIGFMVSGVMAYAAIDKRVVVLEQQAIWSAARDAAIERDNATSRAEMRETLRDVAVSLERLNEKLARQGAAPLK
jgi:hypothetical protein